MSYVNPFDLLDDEGDERPRKQPKAKQSTSSAPKQSAAATSKPSAVAPAPKQPQPAAAKQPQPAQQKQAAPAKAAASSPAPTKKENNDAPKPKSQAGDAQKVKPEGATKKSPQEPRQQQAGGAPARAPKEDVKEAREVKDASFATEEKVHPKQAGDKHRDRGPQRGRQFDRKSGTGRPANEVKRGGSGKGNWGNINEPEDNIAAPKDVEGEKEEADKGEAAAEGEKEPPKEPEKVTKGLDEYYQELKLKAVKLDAPKKREAGEGVDQTLWAGYAPMKKDDDDVTLKPTKGKKKETPKKEAKEANGKAEAPPKVEVAFRLPPPAGTEDRGRGGDRGGRGRGGKGGPKGNRGDRDRKPVGNDRRSTTKSEPVLSATDDAMFPKLPGGTPAAPAKVNAPAAPTPAAAPAPAPAVKA